MNVPPIAELLPHAGAMRLLDEVQEAEDERIVCLRRVRGDGLFESAAGLPAWAGVELMAQCVAAWAGWQAHREHRPVRVGFLLGTRSYACDADAFAVGSVLRVESVRNFHDASGMAAFSCCIDAPGARAEARLSVFSPPEPAAYLAAHEQDPPHA